MQPITLAVCRHALATPQQTALVVGTLSLTYGQLWTAARNAAAWLMKQGVGRGDRVVIPVSPGDPWFASAYLGAHLLAAIAVPLDAKAAQASRRSVIEQVSPAFVLGAEVLEDFMRALGEEACDNDGACMDLPPVCESDVADILFTSGSTGQPKGVALTHGNIAAVTRNIMQFVGNDASDREVVTVPLNHSFGLGRLRCSLTAGGTLIVVPGLSFPSLVFRALAAHRATGLSCVPTGAAMLLKVGAEQLGAAAQHLKYVELGSAAMDRDAKLALMRLLPTTRICMHYGLTEASRSAFIEFHADLPHLDSVGKPAANVEIAVRDAHGADLPTGQVGRIQVRADTVMKEYWRDPGRSSQSIDCNGWLDTGDLGYFDSDGYLFLQGRKDDVINVGGRKVYPASVEQAAALHAGVAESACVGVSDAQGMLGEIPVLFWVPVPGESLEQAHLRRFLTQRLEPHAVPRYLCKVTHLPKTDSGKLLRAQLKIQAMDALARSRG